MEKDGLSWDQIREYRREGIRYWEMRRVPWNALLVLPSFLGWGLGGAVAAGVGDPATFGFGGLIFCLVVCIVGANIAYSTVYVMETLMMVENRIGEWRARGRTSLFVRGCIGGMGLAFGGGTVISWLEYPPWWMTAGQ